MGDLFDGIEEQEIEEEKRKAPSSDRPRILVVGMNYIGDTLFTTPLIRALAKHRPNAVIDVLNGVRGTAMLTENPHVASVIPKPARGDKKAMEQLIARLAETRYESAVIASTSFESAWIPYRAKIPVRSGIRSELRSFMLTHAQASKNRHIILRILDALEPLSIPSDGVHMELVLTKAEEKDAISVLSKKRLAKEKFLVVHAGATRRQKRWPVEYFIKLITTFRKSVGAPVVLIGGPEDAMLNTIIAADCKKSIALDLTAAVSLRVLAGVIRNAWAFVGNDSAPLHIASAMNVHTVGLFGQTDPLVYGTLHEGGTIISARQTCPPLKRALCSVTRGCRGAACMDNITVEEVLDALRAIYSWA
ncbi:MAG: lipopolysaccharide heptosyltransferase II [Spirochaetota bacterium]